LEGKKSGLAGGFPGLCYDGREHPAAVITEPDWNSGERKEETFMAPPERY